MTLLSVESVFRTIGSVLLAVLILLIMITVHEFGHYIAGKVLKFKINEFAIGFGPKIFKRKSKKTGEVFSIRALPLGGFCAFEGEDGEAEEDKPAAVEPFADAKTEKTAEAEENPEPKIAEQPAETKRGEAFTDKAPWKRIIVLIAGPLMNYLLALFLILISMFAFGQMVFRPVKIAEYVGENAEQYNEYCLHNDDLILKVENKGIYLTTDLMSALNKKVAGDKVQLLVNRGGEEITIEVMLRADCNFQSSEEAAKVWEALGIDKNEEATAYLVGVQNYRFGFFSTIGRSFVYSFRIAGSIFKVLGELLTGKIGISSMGGPVTTIKLTSQLASQNLQSFFEIASYIGVNLAVFNLLPIPALDGSKVIFCLIEWIFKKPVPRKIEAVIHAVGFVLILGFAILVDLLQFVHC